MPNLAKDTELRAEFKFLRLKNLNHEKYCELNNRSEILSLKDINLNLSDNYRLVRYDAQQGQFELALLCDISESVIYYLRCNVWQDLCLHETPVTQILLWRSNNEIHMQATHNFARSIFKNYLLSTYGMIASDANQSALGQQFWEAQIGTALRNNHFVYRYDRMSGQVKRITDYNAILDYSCDLWGDDSEKYEHILALISLHPISPRERELIT